MLTSEVTHQQKGRQQKENINKIAAFRFSGVFGAWEIEKTAQFETVSSENTFKSHGEFRKRAESVTVQSGEFGKQVKSHGEFRKRRGIRGVANFKA